MEIIRTTGELRARLAREPDVCCVPTMGNIHDGHLSLVKIAVKTAPVTVTTIFVNRLQFQQGEDFECYPRTFEEDCAKLDAVGNAIVFHPDEAQMYPEPQAFFVDPPKVAKKLEGRFRPGHFRGVCTVVSKLFNTLKQFREETGKTLFLAEQNVKILRIADRIIGLEGGEVKFVEKSSHLDEKSFQELYMGE